MPSLPGSGPWISIKSICVGSQNGQGLTSDRHVEGGVLVAVADSRLQNLEGRGKADGGLFLDQRVDVAHVALGPGPGIGGRGGDAPLRLDPDRLGVALDERLRLQEAVQARIARPRLEIPWIAHLDDSVLR